MPTRPYWHGHIRLSLVSLPVRLYLAVESRETALHRIHKPTGERIHYQNIVPGYGAVNNEDITKGFEYEKGQYVLLEPAEIDALKIESKKIFDILQFAEAKEVDPVYFERPYYVAPDGAVAEEAFIVLREALRETGKMGIGQIVLGGREHVAGLRHYRQGLLLETLHYANEIRNENDYFGTIKETAIDNDQLALAKELIERKTTPFNPAKFEDHYRMALEELIRAKLEHRPVQPETETAPPVNGVNLMDALKRSLEAA